MVYFANPLHINDDVFGIMFQCINFPGHLFSRTEKDGALQLDDQDVTAVYL